jgi:hypothetical protein
VKSCSIFKKFCAKLRKNPCFSKRKKVKKCNTKRVTFFFSKKERVNSQFKKCNSKTKMWQRKNKERKYSFEFFIVSLSSILMGCDFIIVCFAYACVREKV